MPSLQRTARIAGFLYLLVVLSGPFVLIYVPGKLIVSGNATATVGNIFAHQSLFLAQIVVGILSELLFISVVLVLYQLLKEVGPRAAAVMALLVLIEAPFAFWRIANQVAALSFVRGGDSLRAFDKPQRDALAMMLLDWNKQGVLVAEIFWGLWLLPLGWLVYRSGFLPRLLGGWLIVNGLAYVALSLTGLLSPQSAKAATSIATPVLFGEVAFMLWLLVVGARPRSPAAAAS